MTAPKGANTSRSGRTYRVQGRELPSASTLPKMMVNEGLEVWKQKRIAAAIALDPNLRAMAERGDEYAAVRQVLDTSSPEALMGDDVHTATELYDLQGVTTSTIRGVQPFLDRWIEARLEYGIEIIAAEQTVANLELGYAGTFDRIVRATQWTGCEEGCESHSRQDGGAPIGYTLDIKTGKVHASVALQLAAYSYAPDIWDPDFDELTPAPIRCLHWGLVADLKADRPMRLIPVYLPDGYAALVGCKALAEFAQVEKHVLSEPVPRPVGGLPW